MRRRLGVVQGLLLLRADDLTVFPVTDPVATIVSASHPGLVDTVLVAGRVVKRDGVLVGVDLAALRTRLVESRNRIAAAAGIPLDGTWRHGRNRSRSTWPCTSERCWYRSWGAVTGRHCSVRL
ncbi:hypothetical protein ABT124_41690 [Streptomyces sp. NPDC001982]|uniref:hypothetical protein n=1 Tax=unclassified Streptomyces TaxID=2593676 RepID=UPI003319434C